MTVKGVYEAVLTELNKVQAPSFTLEDFNYLCNKAINQYINRKYNIYDVNQQTADDLRVLKATATLTPVKATVYGDGSYDPAIDGDDVEMANALYGATYEVNLPDDYLHLLNCVCIYKVEGQNYKCYNKDNYISKGANRLTADMWPQIIDNAYLRPSYQRPYYYIHNVNINNEIPTDPIELDILGNVQNGTDYAYQEPKPSPTPESVSLVYGIANGNKLSDLLGTIKSDIHTQDVSGNTIMLRTSSSSPSRIVYIKIPDTETSIGIESIQKNGNSGSDNIPYELLQTEEYQTEGYNTFIGYLSGYKPLGYNLPIYINLTRNE